jgi:hypothetical protein
MLHRSARQTIHLAVVFSNLPAIRYLHELFPSARVSSCAGRRARKRCVIGCLVRVEGQPASDVKSALLAQYRQRAVEGNSAEHLLSKSANQ